ncbi:MAG: 2-iminoacetate synthase ThiH [Wigglesworthia glossinidia]|nr:2-iminoacetate synthase ThiH [Wigglesworthia glossinidia]
MNSFQDIWKNIQWNEIANLIFKCNENDVKLVLSKKSFYLNDIIPILSKAAGLYLEKLSQIAQKLTQIRFGKTIRFFAPLYLSNFCANDCTYCGFSMKNKIRRKVLNSEEVLKECHELLKNNINHVLLVSGEHDKIAGINYFSKIILLIRKQFSSILMEVQPLSTQNYSVLKNLGLDGVVVYQETYDIESYKKNHIYGKKRDFFWRLNTPERIAQANIEKIGLGILVGLSDNWRVDCYFLACHISYLRKLYWKSNYSISILRLRPCLNGMQPYSIMTDRELLQIMCAFRIFFPEIEISLSTRESATFRDHVSPILANNISAGSKTNPGGYITSKTELEQFYPQDNRSPKEVSNALKKYGLSSVWKDWDYYLGR